MERTQYYNLTMDNETEYYSVARVNDNTRKIDAALHALEEGKASLGEDGKVAPEQLPDMDIQALLADAQLKESLVDNDAVVVTDSAAGNAIKRVLWSKIKGLFALASHHHAASDITSGTLSSARIPDLAASKITSGTLDGARIPDLAASKITSGTLDGARIPDLAASKITSGTLPVSIGGTGQTTITPGITTSALRAIYGGTSSMTASSTSLATGCVYLQYE